MSAVGKFGMQETRTARSQPGGAGIKLGERPPSTAARPRKRVERLPPSNQKGTWQEVSSASITSSREVKSLTSSQR